MTEIKFNGNDDDERGGGSGRGALEASRPATFVRPSAPVTPEAEATSSVAPDGALVTEFAFVVNLKFNRDYNQIPIRTILTESITEILQPYFDDYYDQLRYGKTLLNFDKGSDLPISMANEQLQIINWKRAGGNKVVLRLKNVLPTGYQVGRRAMVVREIQNPVFDVIKFLPVEVGPLVPELRPSSPSFRLGTQNKVTGRLVDLIPGIAGTSGSLNVSSSYSNFVSNQVLENYYNVNQKSMEINADYSNFENFVTFGSAQKRIDVFKAKLDKIQDLITTAPVLVEDLNISGSSAESGSYNTVFGTLVVAANGTTTLSQSGSSVVYDLLTTTTGSLGYAASASVFVDTSRQVSKQIQELIRNFDGYESELWFESNLPYSASDESNFDRNNQYKADYTYPKILGLPLATTDPLVSGSAGAGWHPQMTAIAVDYDVNNKNRLTENIPDYLWDDEDSVDFVTFTDLIGHHFDNVKIYIKNLENLSSRYPKIDKEISAPMAANVIQSFGVSIPSISSVESLVRYVSGDNTGSVSYKKIADEYYNRYVHALPFLLKTKGTKQSINSLLNVFGINPNLITVRESLKGSYTTIEPVKVTTTEQDFGLEFNSGSWLRVPFSASLRQPKTIQARVSLLDARNQTILNFEPSSSYRLNVERHPSAATNTYYTNYGRLDLVSGSSATGTASLATTEYFDLFDENPVSIQLKYDAAGVKFDVRKIENEETTFSASLQESAPSMSADWGSLSNLYIGPPAKSSSVGYHLSASLDEFRTWGEQVSDAKFIEFVENPGMYAGNTYSSSLQNLHVRLSFNLPEDVRTLGYVTNTTPYENKSQAPTLATIASSADNADGIAFSVGSSPMYQFKRSIRTVIESSYKVGASTRTTDMIRIAPVPPLSGSLSRTATLTSIDKKFQTSSMGSTNIDISISPLDAVDRDVIRSFGNINLGDYIGRPIDRNADNYPLLDDIENTFVKDLAPTIDYNAFIRFFDKFLHLFGETIKDYFPARAKITDGIVIRSPILNRNKLRGRETIKIGGENTRRTNNAITSTTDKDVIRSFDPVLSISSSFVNELQADYSSIDSSLSLSDYTGGATVSKTFIVSVDGYDQSGFNSLNGIIVRPNKDRDLTQLGSGLFPTPPSLLAGNSTASLLSTTPIQNAVLSFGPVDDFTPDNVGAYTYFDQSHGLTYIDAIRHTPVTQSWMSTAPNVVGNWSSGTSYNLGDVVTQPTGTKLYLSGSTYSSGSNLSRNGQQYICQPKTDRTSAFKSLHPPQLDGHNWVPLKYNKKWYQRLARFVYVGNDTDNISVFKNIIIPGLTVSGTGVSAGTTISSITNTTTFVMSAVAVAAGTVDLTFTDSDGNSFVHTCTTTVTGNAAAKKIVTHVARYDSLPSEYTKKHFIFFRDNSIGARRRTYEGTLNTATTTIDVGQPFEVFDINVQTIRVGGTDRASGGGGTPPIPPIDEEFNGGDTREPTRPPRDDGGTRDRQEPTRPRDDRTPRRGREPTRPPDERFNGGFGDDGDFGDEYFGE